MAIPPERSRPLHNFTLPGRLRWGNQRFLRCMKVNNNNNASTTTAGVIRRSESRPGKEVIGDRSPVSKKSSPAKKSPIDDDNGEGIDAVREKLMLDLRVATDRMKVSIFEEREKEVVADSSSNPSRPCCNLHTRRAVCKEPKEPNCAKSSRLLRGLAALATTTSEKETSNPRPKFSASLSRAEIESDFLAMTGRKPARRPKKRPRPVQRQLDSLFPGTWLTEVTPETYKVPDIPEPGKASK